MIRQEQMQVVKQTANCDEHFRTNIKWTTCTGYEINLGNLSIYECLINWNHLLRRPISIASIDKETLEFTMIYRAEGRGTTLLSEKNRG